MTTEIERLLAVCRRILDRDVVSPFHSAWEIDPHGDEDGEKLYADLKAAVEAFDSGEGSGDG